MIRRIIFFSIISIFILQPSLFAQEAEEIERLIEMGIEYERGGKLEKATDVYRDVLSKDPNNIMIKIRLAKILSWQNEFDWAIDILDEVLEYDPSQEEAILRKAQILSWQGRYTDAISMYESYLTIKPEDPDALMGIARTSFWTGSHEEAISYFNRAIEAGADEAEARLDLSKVYLSMNEKLKAEEELSTVLALDRDNSEAKRLLKGIGLMKTYDVSPVKTRVNIYPDESVGVTFGSEFIYHHKGKWDFIFGFENSRIGDISDTTFSHTTVYRGIQYLYVRGGLAFSPYPNFSPWIKTDLGVSYTFADLFAAGLSLKTNIYESEALFTIIPELRKDFSDITYVALRYNQYLYTTGYSTGSVELLLNFEYYGRNDLFVKAVYGGDVEIRDSSRRVFDFAAGTTLVLTDNLEISLSYGWIETPYGKSHEISWSSNIKW